MKIPAQTEFISRLTIAPTSFSFQLAAANPYFVFPTLSNKISINTG